MKIVVEGLPGSGKTSLATLLANRLKGHFIAELVDTKLREESYDTFYHRNDFLKQQAAARSEYGFTVLDRDYISTLAFNYAQGPKEFAEVGRYIKENINNGNYKAPDIYLYLVVDNEISISRQRKENAGKEWVDKAFLERLQNFYESEFRKWVDWQRVIVLNSTKSASDILHDAINQIKLESNG